MSFKEEKNQKNNIDYKAAGLKEYEYDRILKILGREPNYLETELIGVMWSEHCSYKSTKCLLRTFPQKGEYVLQGQGENAGVVDVGGGLGFAFKVESHNHPSAVAPYQGAATGVGGIIRDIIAMGARPSVSMDGLFFGDPSLRKTQNLSKGIVEGIAGYGNAVGVPTVGGKTFYMPCYTDNPLVNAFSGGFVRLDKMASSKTSKNGDLAVILGSKTGRDGIAGASFASRELDEDASSSKPQIQIGDPFEEKLLIECCLELLDKNIIASMQDMGAAGILSSSSEIAHKSGCGIDIDIKNIPLREKNMTPREIFLSESQERMLLVVEEKHLDEVFKLAHHWGLDAAVVGQITDSMHYRVFEGDNIIADLPVGILADAPEILWPDKEPASMPERQVLDTASFTGASYGDDLLSLLGSHTGRSKHRIWDQYDSMVQLHTIVGPGYPVSAIEVPGTDSACVLAMEAEPSKCYTNPYLGAAETMALSLRNIWISGAEALGMTNCLNFASPEVPENFYELKQSVKGLADACLALDCPVVSGNVSLYNETQSGGIYPTPLVVTAGIVKDKDYLLKSGAAKDGDAVYLVGQAEGSLGASRYQTEKDGVPKGNTVDFDAKSEMMFKERAVKTAKEKLASSGRALAGGGLAVALAKEAISSRCGISVNLNVPENAVSVLFSEGGPRAIYFVPKDKCSEFEKVWQEFPCKNIGKAGESTLTWEGLFSLTLDDITKCYMGE